MDIFTVSPRENGTFPRAHDFDETLPPSATMTEIGETRGNPSEDNTVAISQKLYPLECSFKQTQMASPVFDVGDNIEFRKQYGIKGLKIYEQAFKSGKVVKMTKTDNSRKVLVQDNKGNCHYVRIAQVRPANRITTKW